MKVKVLGSSSDGNCYLLQTGKETLILEAGISFLAVKKALRFDLSGVVGCIVTHEHQDHSKAVVDMMKYGIKTFAPSSVFQGRTHSGAFCRSIEVGLGYRIGKFKIIALAANHDVPCVSYIIEHEECGRILFATDTMMMNYRIKGLNHIWIECNYADECLQENIDKGIVPESMRKRLMLSHCELKTTKRFLMDNDLSEVREIMLVHISNNNGDKARFVKEVSELTGKPTIIAEPNLEFDLDF